FIKEHLQGCFASLQLGQYRQSQFSIHECTLPNNWKGPSMVVPTTIEDQIFWAKRIGVVRLSRFVKGRNPTLSNRATLILKQIEDGNERGFILLAAHFGSKAPQEPTDKNLDTSNQSIEFWGSHAFVESHPHDAHSVTTKNPWTSTSR
ncbi:MAG: hypothetical protein SGJ02_01780, partial [bacterium]|nr:hypothetical protein [bacterium]